MKVKRIIPALLCVAMAVSSLAGCSSSTTPDEGGTSSASTSSAVTSSAPEGGSETSSTAGGAPEGDPTEITVAFWDVETALAGGDQDSILQLIQTETNVKLTPVNTTWDDYRQKIQLWASSNQLPDIFSIDVVGSSFYYNWTEQGVVLPVPDDLSAYPTLKEYLSTPDIEALRKDDGHLYVIPRTTWEDIKQGATERKCYYRWDLAQKVGVTKEPETYDEFRDMMRKIIAADPDGKGIAGMTVSVTQILDSFFMPYGVPLGMGDGSGSDFKWIEKDGQLVPAYFAGDLKAVFQLARDMYKEGTVEPDIALAKTQLSEDKFLQGKAAAYYVNTPADTLAKKWNDTNPDKKFEDCVKLAKPFPGIDGKKTCPVFKTYWSESYIASTASEKMDAILYLYNWMLENDKTIRFGYEGEDWKEENGAIVRITTDLSTKYPATALGSLVQYANWYNLVLTGNPETDVYRQMDIDYWNTIDAECTLPDYNPRYTNISTPTKNEFVIKPAEDLLKIMTSDEDVGKMYDDLMASYEKNGLSKMIEEVNAAIG